MDNYEQLVKALRICSSELNCGDCPLLYKDSCSSDELMDDAAAAIEALNNLVSLNTERCEGLQKQLREAQEQYEKHLNELEQQLPKRGEIVRCGECKHYNAGFECLVEGYGIERDPDWFCAYGEREVQE